MSEIISIMVPLKPQILFLSLFKSCNFVPLSASIIKNSERCPVNRDQFILLNDSNRWHRKREDGLAKSLFSRLYCVVISVKNQAVVTVFSSESTNNHNTVCCKLACPKALSWSDHKWLAPCVGQLNLFPFPLHVF